MPTCAVSHCYKAVCPGRKLVLEGVEERTCHTCSVQGKRSEENLTTKTSYYNLYKNPYDAEQRLQCAICHQETNTTAHMMCDHVQPDLCAHIVHLHCAGLTEAPAMYFCMEHSDEGVGPEFELSSIIQETSGICFKQRIPAPARVSAAKRTPHKRAPRGRKVNGDLSFQIQEGTARKHADYQADDGSGHSTRRKRQPPPTFLLGPCNTCGTKDSQKWVAGPDGMGCLCIKCVKGGEEPYNRRCGSGSDAPAAAVEHNTFSHFAKEIAKRPTPQAARATPVSKAKRVRFEFYISSDKGQAVPAEDIRTPALLKPRGGILKKVSPRPLHTHESAPEDPPVPATPPGSTPASGPASAQLPAPAHSSQGNNPELGHLYTLDIARPNQYAGRSEVDGIATSDNVFAELDLPDITELLQVQERAFNNPYPPLNSLDSSTLQGDYFDSATTIFDHPIASSRLSLEPFGAIDDVFITPPSSYEQANSTDLLEIAFPQNMEERFLDELLV